MPTEHLEVLIIGNGPSAITLSYLLNGNWPYYNGALKQSSSDDNLRMLHERLMDPDDSEMDCFVQPQESEQRRVSNRCRCVANRSIRSPETTPTATQIRETESFERLSNKIKSQQSDDLDSEDAQVEEEEEEGYKQRLPMDSDEAEETMPGQGRLQGKLLSCFSIFSNYELLSTRSVSKQRILQTSLLERNLEYLSQGLIGRSFNPVSLLLDHLQHPAADLGREQPCALKWQQCRKSRFSHRVLGRGRPGGAWTKMDDCSAALTISLGSWMQLPDYSIRDWNQRREATEKANHQQQLPVSSSNNKVVMPAVASPTKRIRLNAMSDYYRDYVRRQNLESYFEDYTEVRQVRFCHKCKRWLVSGRNEMSGKRFCYSSDNLVLASGCSEKDNRLNVKGDQLPFVLHSVEQLERILNNCETGVVCDEWKQLESNANDSDIQSDQPLTQQPASPIVKPILTNRPVLIVGAGLSAADAILTTLAAGIPVIHVFRKHPDDPSLVFSQLPESLYPEYHQVHALMSGRRNSANNATRSSLSTWSSLLKADYTPFSMHSVRTIRADGEVELLNLMDQSDDGDHRGGAVVGCDGGASSTACKSLHTIVRVRAVLSLIGQQPDLNFIKSKRMRMALPVKPGLPVEPRSNPINVHPYTHECVRVPQLYAMGPLVGDNFVRFLQGGALAICADLWKKQVHKREKSRNRLVYAI